MRRVVLFIVGDVTLGRDKSSRKQCKRQKVNTRPLWIDEEVEMVLYDKT